MTAICVGGAALVTNPLFTLISNQLSRLQTAIQKYGAVLAFHLDDILKSDVKEKIIKKMKSFEYE